MAIVLGIDPGSRITGYGLIDVQGSRLTLVDCGCIRTESPVFPQRLQEIFAGLCQIIDQHVPAEVAIEEVFMGRNPASALKLGQARGSALVACLQRHLPVAEYAPRQVKLALVGRGARTRPRCSTWSRRFWDFKGNCRRMLRMRWRSPSVTPILK